VISNVGRSVCHSLTFLPHENRTRGSGVLAHVIILKASQVTADAGKAFMHGSCGDLPRNIPWSNILSRNAALDDSAPTPTDDRSPVKATEYTHTSAE
jgi:hypothetical protein